MKLIDYFDRVYIVNLPERADRREEMEVELKRFGLNVDGKHIRYFRAIRPESAGDFPSLGARGCFLSHLAIIQEAIRDDLNNVLIMEDDLSLEPAIAKHQESLCQTLEKQHWHFAYFGHVEPLISTTGEVDWQQCVTPLATTHFYALNRSVLRALHAHLQACLRRPSGHPLGSPMHVDGAYSLFRSHHRSSVTLIASPSLGGQRSSRSDIFPNKWYDRTPFFLQAAGLARHLKNMTKRLFKHKAIHGGQAHV